MRTHRHCVQVELDRSDNYYCQMTLILTAINHRCAIQISDRRLTANGALVDDEANKAISLITPDARLTVGFTGLARAGTFDTRDWIMEAVNKAAIIDASAAGIITRFTNIATKTFHETRAIRQVDRSARRLDVVFAGYSHALAPPQIVYALVTNAHANGTTDDFDIHWYQERRPADGVSAWLSAAGNAAALRADDVAVIGAAMQKQISPKDLQAVLHSRMVKIADRPASGGLIGKQFDTIILERDGGLTVTMYDSAVVKNELHIAASIVVFGPGKILMAKDGTIKTDDPNAAMVVPRMRRNKPCSCGSGKRYRDCHGLS